MLREGDNASAADWYLVECYAQDELSYVAALLNYKFCRGSGELHKEQRTGNCV